MSMFSSDAPIVSGMVAPGTVKLDGFDRPRGWDVKDASGQDGGTTSRKGQPIGKGTMTHRLSDWPDESGLSDYDRWPAYQALLESSTDGEEPIALEIVHPDLQRNHFTAIVLGSIGPHIEDGTGGGTIKVEVLEYRPPKPKTSASPGSAAANAGDNTLGPGGLVETDPRQDAADDELEAAQREAEAAWQ